MSDNNRFEATPFDHDIDGIDDYDNQFGEEGAGELNEENLDEVRGKSELSNDTKVRQKGQKASLIFMSILAVVVGSFMTYKMFSARHSLVQDKKEETKTEFKKPEQRTFGEQFNDSTASSTAYTVASSPAGIENEPTNNSTHGLSGSYPTTTIEPPPSYSSSEVSHVQAPTTVEAPVAPTPATQAPNIEAPPVVTEVPTISPEEERKIRIYKSGLNISSAQGGGNAQPVKTNQDKDPLATSLSPAELDGTSAVAMKNRDMVLTKGSTIDCVLNTKFDSTVIGMITCSVTRNVYSASGRVVLIDRGSKVIGEYKGGMQQGQNRVFILWNRIETPKGVIIDVNSPASGSLGEAGVDGRIDTKFLKRFGGAMLVSFVSDLGKAVSEAAAQKTIGGNVNLEDSANTAQQMASAELEKSINIPPSLIKHQGDRVGITVARDIYFGNVYELKRKK